MESLVWMLPLSMLHLNFRKLSLSSFGVVTKKNDNHNYLKRLNKYSSLFQLYIQLNSQTSVEAWIFFTYCKQSNKLQQIRCRSRCDIQVSSIKAEIKDMQKCKTMFFFSLILFMLICNGLLSSFKK